MEQQRSFSLHHAYCPTFKISGAKRPVERLAGPSNKQTTLKDTE